MTVSKPESELLCTVVSLTLWILSASNSLGGCTQPLLPVSSLCAPLLLLTDLNLVSLNPGQWGGRPCVWDGEQPKFYSIKEVRPCPSDKLSEQIKTLSEDDEQMRQQLESVANEGKREIDEALKTETKSN